MTILDNRLLVWTTLYIIWTPNSGSHYFSRLHCTEFRQVSGLWPWRLE